MLKNPCKDVTPILCIVKLQPGEVFKPNLLDSYKYISIGGNHSRQALQELIRDNKDLEKNKLYTYRWCSVYQPMEVTLARRLASKHNRAGSFKQDMTNWDWVIINCVVKMLYKQLSQRVKVLVYTCMLTAAFTVCCIHRFWQNIFSLSYRFCSAGNYYMSSQTFLRKTSHQRPNQLAGRKLVRQFWLQM